MHAPITEKQREQKWDVEALAPILHDIYQAEAKRQGDVRHADKYEDLPENIKEFDRVLSRFVAQLLADYAASVRLETAKVCRDNTVSTTMSFDFVQKWYKEYIAKLERALAAKAEGGGK